MADADVAVRDLAGEIATSLTEAMAVLGMPAVPTFNDVSWTRYPEGRGHITAHRDPPAYGGVIAVVTLAGAARFQVWDEPEGVPPPSEWRTRSGDLVVLRGQGWPRTHDLCPRHGVEPPVDGDRMIMTLRYNTRGAGVPYDL